MWLPVLFAAAAQLADLLTRPPEEANPLVVALGPSASVAKLLLIVAISGVAVCLAGLRRPRRATRLARRALLGTAVVAGSFGTAINLLTLAHWHP